MEPLTADVSYMKMAIEEAQRGAGFVSPNPLVGCVIVSKDEKVLAKGYHAYVGGDHAEVHALKQIKNPSDLIDARVYVTLEPCSHYGRTPPCADALAQTPIAEVIYGLQDPDPRVSGRGLERLKQANKRVRQLTECEAELRELTEVFLCNKTRLQAFVTLKVATSLDGMLALKSGESQWISHPPARESVQRLRGEHDAILIGAGTAMRDRPRLTARDSRFEKKRLRAVVLDLNDQLGDLTTFPFAQSRPPEDVLRVVRDSNRDPKLASNVVCPLLPNGMFDLQELKRILYKNDICSVLVEGGAVTHSQFLIQQAADRLSQFISPVLLGQGLGWTKDLLISEMSSRIELENPRWLSIAPDMFLTGKVRYS